MDGRHVIAHRLLCSAASMLQETLDKHENEVDPDTVDDALHEVREVAKILEGLLVHLDTHIRRIGG